MTKPREGWVIAEGGASARRMDGVIAGFFFVGGLMPYGVKRTYETRGRGWSTEYLRRAGSMVARHYSSLEKAMEGADKLWPPA